MNGRQCNTFNEYEKEQKKERKNFICIDMK